MTLSPPYLLRVSFSIVRLLYRTGQVKHSSLTLRSVLPRAEAILGLLEDESSYLQASNPSLGGLGLRRTVVHADTAYAASFLEAMGESGERWAVPSVVLSCESRSQKDASYNIDKKIHAQLVEHAHTRREKQRYRRSRWGLGDSCPLH